MADNAREASTPNYTVGYGDAAVRRLRHRTAATCAAYLLPHLKPGMRLLDIGCGPGTISVGLASAVDPGEFYGIDMAGSQIELAAVAARERGLSNARFQAADAADLPFPDDHFDVVHCHTVLGHIPDTLAALAEIKRVLKTGGILGAREHVEDSSFIEPDIGNLQRLFTAMIDLGTANGGHTQLGRELRVRFSEAGFVDIEASGSFDSFGSSSDAAVFAGFIIDSFLGTPIADQAVSHGIATRDEFDEWRKAAIAWKDHPGAFAAHAYGEAMGRKP